VTEDERQALMDRNLAAARQRVEAADDADRATEATEAVRGGVPWISITSMAEAIDAALSKPTKTQSPREIIEAHLATLTPEQRTRVTIGADGYRSICVDDKVCITAPDEGVGSLYFGACNLIDRALAKPAPQERPAVGTTHPFAVAEADQRAHPEANWVGVGGRISMFTRLPDDQPDGVPEDCNCEQARELREELEHVRGLLDDVRANRVEDRKTRDALRNQISGGNDDIDKLRDDCDAARETIARLTNERHVFVEVLLDETEKLEKRIDECDSLRAQLADAVQERDELRTILALAAQAVNNLAHGTWGSK